MKWINHIDGIKFDDTAMFKLLYERVYMSVCFAYKFNRVE